MIAADRSAVRTAEIALISNVSKASGAILGKVAIYSNRILNSIQCQLPFYRRIIFDGAITRGAGFNGRVLILAFCASIAAVTLASVIGAGAGGAVITGAAEGNGVAAAEGLPCPPPTEDAGGAFCVCRTKGARVSPDLVEPEPTDALGALAKTVGTAAAFAPSGAGVGAGATVAGGVEIIEL